MGSSRFLRSLIDAFLPIVVLYQTGEFEPAENHPSLLVGDPWSVSMPWEAFTIEQLIQPLAELASVAFFFVVGGNIGSFLNVVAHRVPLGASVVFGGSRCPACGQAIRPRDNLPVLGWLFLQGRCRDCLVPIPIRYPFVEAVAALVIGSVASIEILSGGYTLPIGNEVTQGRWWRGVDELLFHPNGRLLGICLLHVAGLATLLAWALLEYDRRNPPRRWCNLMWLTLPVVMLFWPWLQPASTSSLSGLDWPFGALSQNQRACLVSVLGLLAGWLIGGLFHSVGYASPFLAGGLALVGCICGWQAIMTVVLIGLFVSGVRRCFTAFCWPAVGFAGSSVQRLTMIDLLAAFTLQLLGWRWIAAGTAKLASGITTAFL